jgi:hypothetical protein
VQLLQEVIIFQERTLVQGGLIYLEHISKQKERSKANMVTEIWYEEYTKVKADMSYSLLYLFFVTIH